MRTTLTLDEDLARDLRRLARHSDRSFKEVVNATLRRGLATSEEPDSPQEPFRVEARPFGLRPSVDPYRLNQVSDELEIEGVRRRLREDQEAESSPGGQGPGQGPGQGQRPGQR